MDETVWLLHISHRHGDDISVHRSERGAREAIVAYVDNYWEDEVVGHMADESDAERPVDDAAAVKRYFELLDGNEWYEIERTPLLP